jgi:hypothetical protein
MWSERQLFPWSRVNITPWCGKWKQEDFRNPIRDNTIDKYNSLLLYLPGILIHDLVVRQLLAFFFRTSAPFPMAVFKGAVSGIIEPLLAYTDL